ncbi:hypothetical protein IVB08_31490 [Bradyrhizobium sp. 173]|nr:hypothetical protein [Bradyrhizobium sp. 173]
MLGLLDRATQLSERKQESLRAEPPSSDMALRTTALAAALLFAHGQTTERTVLAATRLGRALGVAVKGLPQWDELIVELDGSLVLQSGARQAARRRHGQGTRRYDGDRSDL